MKLRVQSIALFFLMVFVAIGAAAFLYAVGIDALYGRNDVQFFADSNTYHHIHEDGIDDDEALVGVARNLVGPLLVLKALDGNPYLVMVFNIALFTLSLLHITRLLGVGPLTVALLLMLSPLTFSALLSVNKEILVFPFVALALHGHVRRSWAAVLLALALSMLVRWQLAAFYVVILVAAWPAPMRLHRLAVLAAVLLGASATYFLLLDWLAPVIENVELSTATGEEGAGLYASMLAQQNRGLYFLVFPVKALHLLFGLGLRFDRLFAPGNLFNDFFVLVHCQAALLVFLALAWKRRLSLQSDLLFASIVFLVVFALTPVFSPRYLYPVFLLWVLVLAGAPRRLRIRAVRAGVAAPATHGALAQ